MEKDQVPGFKGRGGDKGTSGTEARGRSREEGFRTVSGFRKGEPGGEGAGKENQDDQEQQGERLQGLKDSLGMSKGGRSRRLGQGLSFRLSGYSWSLGRGYKIIGYPLPRRAPLSTPAVAMEAVEPWSSLGGCPDTFKSPSMSPAKNTKPSGRGVPSEEIFRPC